MEVVPIDFLSTAVCKYTDRRLRKMLQLLKAPSHRLRKVCWVELRFRNSIFKIMLTVVKADSHRSRNVDWVDLGFHNSMLTACLYTNTVILQNKWRPQHSTNFKKQFVGFAGKQCFSHTISKRFNTKWEKLSKYTITVCRHIYQRKLYR